MAQNEIPSKVQFGDFIQLSSSIGYFPYEKDQFNVYNIFYFDYSALIPLNKLLSFGLSYNYIDIKDSFQERNSFFRSGSFIRFQEYSLNEKFVYNIDLSVDYGNFTIEFDSQELIKREGFYLGLKSGGSYNVFANMYVMFGLKFIRRFGSYNYGIEIYPYVGISYRIPTRRR